MTINKTVVMAAVLQQPLMGSFCLYFSRAVCGCQSRSTWQEMEMVPVIVLVL